MSLASETAVVIVTFNRSNLLRKMLESIEELEETPHSVVIVNNGSTDGTADVVDEFAASNSDLNVVPIHLDTNTGGAGGFHTGIREGLRTGANWCLVADDDVRFLANVFATLEPWSHAFPMVVGSKLNPQGERMKWEPRLNEFLGTNPLKPSPQPLPGGCVLANAANFEGTLVHSQVVEKIGLPDADFFITWDDATYGWLAAQYFSVAYIYEPILQRTRDIPQGTVLGHAAPRPSNLQRYYGLRNRALAARYFREYGKLNRFGWTVGTTMALAKQVLLSVAFEQKLSPVKDSIKGILDGRQFREK